MNDSEPTQTAAERMMARLLDEAARSGTGKAVATLRRLKIACDDILSGAAERMAHLPAAREDAALFRPAAKQLNSEIIGRYVRMRARLEGAASEWTGPHPVTIRSNQDYSAYVRERLAEVVAAPPRKARAGTRALSVEAAIADLPLTSQSLIREALEDGRQHKRELDIIRQALKKIGGLDYDVVVGRKEGKSYPFEMQPPLDQTAAAC